MKFLVDNQLPQALARYLEEEGHTSFHVIDLHLDEASDNEIWEVCLNGGFILVSKDEDFFFLANRPGETGCLVWVRIGNCRKHVLLRAVRDALPEVLIKLEGGQRIIELR